MQSQLRSNLGALEAKLKTIEDKLLLLLHLYDAPFLLMMSKGEKDEVISRKVLIDEGLRQVVEVEQAALWKFLWWSGTISVHVFVDQNRKNHTVNFRQGKTGFMKRFEGCWRVEPLFVDGRSCSPLWPRTLAEYESCTEGKGRVASLVTLDQLVQPALVPPPPISWYLRGITTKTTEMLINDLLAEADRLRGVAEAACLVEDIETSQRRIDVLSANDLDGIKERWRQRRQMKRRQNLCA
ncbi:hypothetical protein Taro_047869 [Colocasia esculenta]|uniref:DUF220 domain-containing protein n=1 Tax=Colocasia esculenta TaxID=4460 RepID=A0A843WWK9_COLES|nr:hypothetical protein [Colocasia esculenta]